jgi:hypothetical protein
MTAAGVVAMTEGTTAGIAATGTETAAADAIKTGMYTAR